MAFVVRRATKEDMDWIYPDAEEVQLVKFTFPKRTFPLVERHGALATDEERGVFLSKLPSRHREDLSMQYLFGWKTGVAIIRYEDYCQYSIRYLSSSLEPEIETVKRLIAEAFRVAGTLINEEMAKDEVFAVPYVEFVSSPEKGGKA